MKIPAGILCLFILCSCAASKFSGSDIKAVKHREEAAAMVLDAAGPDGCSYNTYKGVYNCDEGVDPVKINKQVLRARENIIEYLRKNPYVTNTDKLGFIILEDLYYCRNANGMIPKKSDIVIYCETKLPSFFKDMMKEEELSLHETRYNKLYKYIML